MKTTLYRFSAGSGQLAYLGNFQIDTENDKIAEGGEGIIYNLGTEKVVKIYKWKSRKHEDRDSKLKKITYMIENPPGDISYLAWPENLVFTDMSTGISNFVGFVMKAFHAYYGIGNVYDSDERNRIFKSSNWGFLFIAARNVAHVVEQLHDNGYFLGDINEGNILVNDKAQVAFIDCDSYKKTGKDFGEGTVGVDEYTPKERLDNGELGVENIIQERFSLSILLFKILMLGANPFNILYEGKGDVPTRSQNIKACKSIFSGEKLPLSTPPLWVLPDTLLTLFSRAVGTGCSSSYERPSSREWYDAFEVTRKMKLKHCKVSRYHIYYGNSNDCPWCLYGKETGTDPFPPTSFDVTFILEDFDMRGKWILSLDGKSFRCDRGSIIIPLAEGIHTFGVKTKKGNFYASESEIIVKDKPITQKITLKPRRIKVQFKITGIEWPAKVLFTFTRYDSYGSPADKKDQIIDNISEFNMFFIPGLYSIEGQIPNDPNHYEMTESPLDFRVEYPKKTSQNSQILISFRKKNERAPDQNRLCDVSIRLYAGTRHAVFYDLYESLIAECYDEKKKLCQSKVYSLEEFKKYTYSSVKFNNIPPGTYFLRIFLSKHLWALKIRTERIEIYSGFVSVKIDSNDIYSTKNSYNHFKINLESSLNEIISSNKTKVVLLKYALVPIFSASLSAVSIFFHAGIVPLVFLSMISAISIFDFLKSKRKNISIFLMVLLVLSMTYISLFIADMAQTYGIFSFYHSIFIVYLLLIIYSISLLILVFISDHIGLNRTRAFLPAAIVPVVWLILFEIGIL